MCPFDSSPKYISKYTIRGYRPVRTDLILFHFVLQSTSVFNSVPLSLLAPNGSLLSFGTEFYFQTDSSACLEGDNDTDTCGSGFAFVIQSTSPRERGSYGADTGYGNTQSPALGTAMGFAAIRGIQIEFDFRKSPIMNDSDGEQRFESLLIIVKLIPCMI